MSNSKRTSCDYIEFFSELHESNFFLLNVFKNLLKFGQFDCILYVENKSYPVHKLVLASCSPFFAEFLFKFPSVAKLVLIFANLKSHDVLQLLSFLYYGHAIISNHKKTSIAKFKTLLDVLAINNLNYRESHDGRLILQSLHETPFESPPNTITFDFNIDANNRKEPHVVLSHDEYFDLKNALDNVSGNGVKRQLCKRSPEPIGLIGIDTNGDVYFEPSSKPCASVGDKELDEGGYTGQCDFSTTCKSDTPLSAASSYNGMVFELSDGNKNEHAYYTPPCANESSVTNEAQGSNSTNELVVMNDIHGANCKNGSNITNQFNESNVSQSTNGFNNTQGYNCRSGSNGISSGNGNSEGNIPYTRMEGTPVGVVLANASRSEVTQGKGDSRPVGLSCNYNCASLEDGEGVSDNFDIVDNEVVIETSDENSETNMNSEGVFGYGQNEDRPPWGEGKKDLAFGGKIGPNGMYERKQENMAVTNQMISDDEDIYFHKGLNKLDVNFDVDFKPIVIENNANTNVSIVKTGKCAKNNCYVTVFVKEEYDDRDGSDEDGEKENRRQRTGGGRTRNHVDQTVSVGESAGKLETLRIDVQDSQQGSAMTSEEHCYSADKLPDSFVGFNRTNNEGDADIPSCNNSLSHTDGKSCDNYFNNQNSMAKVEHDMSYDDSNSDYKSSHFQSVPNRNAELVSTNETPAQYRDNIQLLIEASNVLLDTSHDVTTPPNPSRLGTGNINTDMKRDRSSLHENNSNTPSSGGNATPTGGALMPSTTPVSSALKPVSRSKRKQTFNERSYDGDDVDFYEQTDEISDNEFSLCRNRNKPYRRSLRRLDFNTFAYKRVKTEYPTGGADFVSIVNKTTVKRALGSDTISSYLSMTHGHIDARNNTEPTGAPLSFDCTRVDSFRNASSFVECAVRVNSGGVRAVSGEERKQSSMHEEESEGEEDSEATVSVEDFATSAECYDDAAREATLPTQSSSASAMPSDNSASVGFRSDKPASMGFRSDNAASVGFRYDNPASIGFRSDNPAPVGFRSDNAAPVGFRSDNPASMGFRSDNPASIGFRSDNPASVGFRSDNAVSVGFRSDNPAFVVFRSDNPASVGFRSDNPASVGFRSDNNASVGFRSDNISSVGFKSDNAVSVGFKSDNAAEHNHSARRSSGGEERLEKFKIAVQDAGFNDITKRQEDCRQLVKEYYKSSVELDESMDQVTMEHSQAEYNPRVDCKLLVENKSSVECDESVEHNQSMEHKTMEAHYEQSLDNRSPVDNYNQPVDGGNPEYNDVMDRQEYHKQSVHYKLSMEAEDKQAGDVGRAIGFNESLENERSIELNKQSMEGEYKRPDDTGFKECIEYNQSAETDYNQSMDKQSKADHKQWMQYDKLKENQTQAMEMGYNQSMQYKPSKTDHKQAMEYEQSLKTDHKQSMQYNQSLKTNRQLMEHNQLKVDQKAVETDTVTADRQLIKEYALSQLGLMCKMNEERQQSAKALKSFEGTHRQCSHKIQRSEARHGTGTHDTQPFENEKKNDILTEGQYENGIEKSGVRQYGNTTQRYVQHGNGVQRWNGLQYGAYTRRRSEERYSQIGTANQERHRQNGISRNDGQQNENFEGNINMEDNSMDSDEQSEESDEYDDEDEDSFTNVYKQMEAIHGNEIKTVGRSVGQGNDGKCYGGNENQRVVYHTRHGNEDGKCYVGNGHEKGMCHTKNGNEGEIYHTQNGNEGATFHSKNEIEGAIYHTRNEKRVSACLARDDNQDALPDDNEDSADDNEYVDNTDEDADYDPYYEDESEDSDAHPSVAARGRVVSHPVSAAPKRCEYEGTVGTVYYCTPCNRRYHTKTGFSQHKRFECGKPPAFQCLMCCKEFNRKSSLKRHLRQIHKTNLQLNVNCVVHFDKLAATKPGYDRLEYRRHYRVRRSPSPSSTSSEDVARKSRPYLRPEHGLRLSPPCWMLSNAMFGHQGAAEDPPDSLTLEQFDRLRKRQPQPPVSLFSHFYLNPNAPQAVPRRRRRRTAVNNGPIICTKCGSQYKTRKSLRAHIRIQCGKEPNFHCPLCPKKTYQKIHIEVHMSRVHKIGGWRYNEPIHND
ncbi:hypothetical protein M8J76_012070 [Diaphorina citri]|nr:hypothetical protein M8J76_012070 [Diaphorina citri]